jgi:hypothetical protein
LSVAFFYLQDSTDPRIRCSAFGLIRKRVKFVKFSIAGMLTDPDQDPAYLTTLVVVTVNANKGSYKPDAAVILAKYKQQFCHNI